MVAVVEASLVRVVRSPVHFEKRHKLIQMFLDLALVLVEIALAWMHGPVTQLSNLYSSEYSLTGLSIPSAALLMLFCIIVGLIGAWVAVRRHLKSLEPA